MSDLSKKTLSQLDTIESLLNDDCVLIERNGRLKRFSANPIMGDNIYVIDLTSFDYVDVDDEGNTEPLM